MGSRKTKIFELIYDYTALSYIIINMRYKNNNNIRYSAKYHIVWCTKYRKQILLEPAVTKLKEIIQEVCLSKNIEILAVEIMPDHVHLLLEIDPQYGVHKAVKALKGVSSRLLRKQFTWLRTRVPTLWTNSYFLSTVGGAPLSAIKQYIEQQKDI